MILGRLGLFLAVVGLIAPLAVAGTIRHDRNASLYTGFAQLPRFDSVGMLTANTSLRELVGSGTLISPTAVLTAAHLLDDARSISFKIGGTTYSGASWIAHPAWSGDLAAGWDLGILQLSTPVASIPPAIRYTGAGELGSLGMWSGFGMTGSGLTGATTRDRLKRAGTNTIDTFYSSAGAVNNRVLMVDFDNPASAADSSYGRTVPTNLEGLIASGDSGGGLFVSTRRGYRLAGVATFGSAVDGLNNADYGDLAGFTRVSAFNSWIDGVLGGFAGAGATSGTALIGSRAWMLRRLGDDGIGAGAIAPEPSSLALLAGGLGTAAALAWRKRRARRG